MTREQKIEWLASATNEELVRQMETSVIWKMKTDERLGFFHEQTRAFAEDVELVRAELMKRLAK